LNVNQTCHGLFGFFDFCSVIHWMASAAFTTGA
jgi:hypothetical protein